MNFLTQAEMYDSEIILVFSATKAALNLITVFFTKE